MGKFFFIATIIASVSGIAIAEERAVEPTAFESFVARASVVLELDEPVGSIVSSDAKLKVAATIEDLAGIEDGIAALEAETGAPWRVQGTARCWMPARPTRIPCPAYGVGPEGSGLRLGAYGGAGFSFPGHRPSEFAQLLEKAAAALRAP